MADAAGNAVIAPPDDLPDDEHDAWTRFVILGAGEQFKLPDAEKNSRLSAAQRGTARRNRRRDNRDLLARLEAAAQPIPALPAEQQPCPAIQAIAGPSNPAIDYEVLERGVQLRRVEPGDDIHFPFHGDTVFFECSPMHRAWVHTLCAPWGRFTVGAASNTWMSPNHGYVPVMFDVAITRMSLGETVSLRAPAGAPFIFVGHLLPEHVRPAGWLGVAAGPGACRAPRASRNGCRLHLGRRPIRAGVQRRVVCMRAHQSGHATTDVTALDTNPRRAGTPNHTFINVNACAHVCVRTLHTQRASTSGTKRSWPSRRRSPTASLCP